MRRSAPFVTMLAVLAAVLWWGTRPTTEGPNLTPHGSFGPPGVITAPPSTAPVAVKPPLTPTPHVVTHRPTTAPKARATSRTHTVRPADCIVGHPCALKGLVWTRTIGCTKVWLTNQRRLNPAAQCPPGYPYLG